jgi:hypothetical protein
MIFETVRNSLLKRTSLSYALVAFLMLTTMMISFFSLPAWPSQQQQHEVLAQEQEQQMEQQQEPGSVLKLSRANTPIDIPLSKGYIDGNIAYFIATDASDKQAVDSISNNTGFPVNYAPLLAQTPNSSRGQGYIFTNGIKGEASNGFQIPVANAVPGDEDYSPLWQTNFVRWNDNVTSARELKSVEEIMAAQSNGELTITNTNIIVNSPAIKWQGGELQIKQNKTITDNTPYGEGQVLNIDTDNMVVTMVAHRGWGPDGKTVYYLVTDATPKLPADMMGVAHVPLEEQLARTPVAVDLFQFMNGINGSGPVGFQAGIGAANPDDANYSPMWRISFIEWKDASNARILETVSDINAMVQPEMITVTPALNGTHVVNCPFFDQSTVMEHQSKST